MFSVALYIHDIPYIHLCKISRKEAEGRKIKRAHVYLFDAIALAAYILGCLLEK